jgi:hypothetical protein
MYPYRVFISYSHEDEGEALQIARHLRRIGLRPTCMADFRVAVDFLEQVRNSIAYAHAFMPVLTEGSESRPWVQQEIGYAMGLEVPVLPVAIGHLPEAFLQRVQALRVRPDLKGMPSALTAEKVESVVQRAQRATHAVHDCAREPEDRMRMLVDYAQRVLDLGEHGRLRYLGGLTSFSVPDVPWNDPMWRVRYGGKVPAKSYCEMLREERAVLEQHVRRRGCDLIVDTWHDYKRYGDEAWQARLETLLRFLRSMPDNKVRVVQRPREGPENLLIIGDWFMADSAAVGRETGYLHTTFSRHAPTVLEGVRKFDSDFQKLLRKARLGGVSSRLAAIRAIAKQIKAIELNRDAQRAGLAQG